MARRAIWTGSISFGLVNIPVRLFTATKDEGIRFHMLHDQDKSRLQRRLVSSASGREVHAEHIVKGFEVAKDQYVIVQKDELKHCAPEKNGAIDITDFVDLSEIDPIYFETPYYLAPQPAAVKSYRLLVEAMRKTKKIGLAKFVMHEKEHLCALRPVENALCLETMHFAEEVVPVAELDAIPEATHKVGDRELKVAEQLIESLSSKFDPKKYRDEYKDCVMKLVNQKAKGEEIHVQPVIEKKSAKTTDLISALEQSLAHARAVSQGTKRRKSA
ncbi:MAG TPA: Ku protein [Tepidisphaeraceae bacterium]|jgi:DNA end-binding protein Ku